MKGLESCCRGREGGRWREGERWELRDGEERERGLRDGEGEREREKYARATAIVAKLA